MMRRLVMAVVALGLASGCVSVGSVQTADTLGRGNFQFAVEPGVYGGFSELGTAFVPHIDVAGRYGLTDTVDIGARFGSSLLELQGKFLLTDPNDTGKAISLAPSVMALFFGSGEGSVSYANLAVPLLIGLKTGGGSEFVFGPRVTNTILFGAGGGDSAVANLVSVGGSVGYAARISQGFRLMPEVAVQIPVLGAVAGGGDSAAGVGFGGGLVQFKLGLLFGAGRRAPVPVEPTEGEAAAE